MEHKIATLCKACKFGDINDVEKVLTQLSVDYLQLHKRKDVLSRWDDHGLTALHYAVKYNHLEVVKLLVENGADVDAVEESEKSRPIHYATIFTRESDTSILQCLLLAGADVGATDSSWLTPCDHACLKGNICVVAELVKTKMIKIEGRNFVILQNSLRNACIGGSIEVVDILINLINNEAELLTEDIDEFIQIACLRGHEKLLNYLLDLVDKNFGSDKIASVLEVKDIGGKGPLHLAVLGSHLNMTKNLLERGCDVHSPMEGDDTVLHIAAVSGNLEMVEVLLKYIDVHLIDKKNKDGQTPLHKAARIGKYTVVTKLLEVGAEVNNPDGDYVTPIMLAASSSSNVRTIQSIMKHNADIMCTDREYCTALHLATKEYNVKAVKMLLTSDQCIEIINMKDIDGNTALHIASTEGFEDIAVVLMEKGADVKSRNNMNKTPLHLAAYYGQYDVVEKIIDIDSSTIHDNDNDGNVPLHLAAQNGKVEAVKVLLYAGGNTKPPTDTNVLLQHACMYGHREMVELLMSYYDVRETNRNGFNCLDVAVDFEIKETATAILSHEDWKDVLRNRTFDVYSGDVTTPFQKLIRYMPDVAKIAFDRCIETNDLPIDDSAFAISLRYEFIDDVYRKEPGQEKETHVFSDLVRFERKELVSHPLVQAALAMKWQSVVAHFFHFKLILYVCFLTFLTGYILATAPSRETNRSNNCIVVHENATWEIGLLVLFGKYMILFLAIVHLIFEVYQFIQQGKEYLLRFDNLLEWTVYVMSITNVIGDLIVQPYTQNGTICGLYPRSFGASALFLAWFNLFLFIRKVPVFGIYIVMFTFVFKTFFKVFIVFVLFIAAFGFSFFVLLQNTDLDAFKNPWVAMVKVGVMMTGELNFDDLFFNSGAKSADPALWIVFILFVLVLNIVLMNVLVGLAVGDIQEVRKQAELTKSIMMINICMDAQKMLAKSRFRQVFAVDDQKFYPKLLPKNISKDTYAQIKEIIMQRKMKSMAQPKDNLKLAGKNDSIDKKRTAMEGLAKRADSIDEKLAAMEGLAERADSIDEMKAAIKDVKAMMNDIWEIKPREAEKRSDKLPSIGSKKEETATTSDKSFEEGEKMDDNEIGGAKGGSKIGGENDF